VRQVGDFVARLDMTNIWRRAAAPGVALTGDAAIAVDPVWGWGCGWALQSATLLARATTGALRRRSGLDRALLRYRALQLKTFGGHYLHALNYTTGRKFNPIERMMFAAAIRDKETAKHLHAYAVVSIGLTQFAAPRPMLRAARVYLSNLGSILGGTDVPRPVPSLTTEEEWSKAA
jgi:2-polyprenyl-6-methoxyphenol hydroxylase-like FAD-dependent oxidoreductase